MSGDVRRTTLGPTAGTLITVCGASSCRVRTWGLRRTPGGLLSSSPWRVGGGSRSPCWSSQPLAVGEASKPQAFPMRAMFQSFKSMAIAPMSGSSASIQRTAPKDTIATDSCVCRRFAPMIENARSVRCVRARCVSCRASVQRMWSVSTLKCALRDRACASVYARPVRAMMNVQMRRFATTELVAEPPSVTVMTIVDPRKRAKTTCAFPFNLAFTMENARRGFCA